MMPMSVSITMFILTVNFCVDVNVDIKLNLCTINIGQVHHFVEGPYTAIRYLLLHFNAI